MLVSTSANSDFTPNIKWQCNFKDNEWSNYNNDLSIKFESVSIGETLTFKSKNGISTQIKRISFDTAQHIMSFNHTNSRLQKFECRRIRIEPHKETKNIDKSGPSLLKNEIHHEQFFERRKPELINEIDERYKSRLRNFRKGGLLLGSVCIACIAFHVASKFAYDASNNYDITGDCIITKQNLRLQGEIVIVYRYQILDLDNPTCGHRMNETFKSEERCWKGSKAKCEEAVEYHEGYKVRCYTNSHCDNIYLEDDSALTTEMLWDWIIVGIVLNICGVFHFAFVCGMDVIGGVGVRNLVGRLR